jgi:phage anti-repressor protein
MEKLLPVLFNTDLKVNSVDARTLWKNLGSKQEFTHWFKARVDDILAKEGVDYVVDKKLKPGKFGKLQEITDYIITISIAKEMAILERNDTGKQVRKYFIRCEEELKRRQTSIKQEAPVPRAKDDSLAYLNKKLNSTYTRAHWVKHKRAPIAEEYKRLASFINLLALGTKEIEQRQVMTDTGAIRVTNLLIMLIRGFETGNIDTQETRSTFVKLYGPSSTRLTLIDKELINSLVA